MNYPFKHFFHTSGWIRHYRKPNSVTPNWFFCITIYFFWLKPLTVLLKRFVCYKCALFSVTLYPNVTKHFPWDNGFKLLKLLPHTLASPSLIMHNIIVLISYELWAIKPLIHFNKNLIFSVSALSLSLPFLCSKKWYKSLCWFQFLICWN